MVQTLTFRLTYLQSIDPSLVFVRFRLIDNSITSVIYLCTDTDADGDGDDDADGDETLVNVLELALDDIL